MRAAIAAAILLLLTGCAPIDPDKLMGGTPTTTSQQLDCDLIFPAPASDTLTP
jgi:hypothetical protein